MKPRIKFVNDGYWNMAEMSLTDAATPENLQKVQDFCDKLIAKYSTERGCFRHPDQAHDIHVHFTNDYIDFQVAWSGTCGCKEVVERLLEIRNNELVTWNPKRFATVYSTDGGTVPVNPTNHE